MAGQAEVEGFFPGAWLFAVSILHHPAPAVNSWGKKRVVARHSHCHKTCEK